ncbi:MAG: AsmA-like C-terminal region-containing protein [Chloroflexota bacterium]
MKSLRRLLLVILIVSVVAVAALVESFNVLATRHRDQVRQELQKVLGQDVRFASLEIRLFGRPGFVARDFRIADDPRFAATPLLRASQLVLGVSVWDLLFRRLVISSLTLNDPEFQVITDESGQLNLAALVDRKTELRKLPRLKPTVPERKPTPLSFAVDQVRIEHGRVDYLDRSIREPAELRIRNISLNVRGFAPGETTEVRIRAALTEGLGQDLRVDGEISPPPENRSWSQRGVDLTLRFDSLRVPVVARAIAALRDKIPGELDVTGPMALQAKASGTLERPRLDDVTLKIPLFGSSDYNAVINGSVQFTERHTWEDAQLKGRLAIEPLSLAQLRHLKFLAQNLPEALITDGTVNVYGRFEGTWQTLRIGALVRADKAEVDYGSWFRKATDSPATIRARLSRGKHLLVVQESALQLGTNKLGFSGTIDFASAPRLQLKLHSRRSSLPAWRKYFAAPTLVDSTGKFDLDATIAKSLMPSDGDWNLTGRLKLDDAVLKHVAGGRDLENLRAEVAFTGKSARLEAVRFRLGRSNYFLEGAIADLLAPRLAFNLRSPEVDLSTLPAVGADAPLQLKSVKGVGEIYFANGHWQLTGSIASPQGDFINFPYQDLRADVVLASTGLSFKNVWARMLDGVFRADGYWTAAMDGSRELRLAAQVDGVEMRALMGRLLPPLRDRLQGQLSGQGHFRVTSAQDAKAKEDLKGSGATLVRGGIIRNFNLASQLLLRGSGASVSVASASRLPPGFSALVNRPDTNFDSLKANFTIEQNRVSTDDLVITTSDYTITGAGWIGFDRSTNWNGSIVLSPRLTQEVQRDYRFIRYLLDRRSRLSISFRAEGKIPDIAVHLENRALAQALRGGTGSRGGSDGAGDESAKEGKRWLPDALERFLNR